MANYVRAYKNPGAWVDKNFCLRWYITSKAHKGLKGKSRSTADDMYIKKRDPCAHFVEHNSAHAVCLVPLPL